MAIINCKNCGGSVELSADKTFGTCEFCGSTMTFPKVDDEQRAAAFNRGNHFRRIGEFDKALAVYERIVQEDEHDAEAHWCCALCRFGIEYVEDPVTFEWIPTCHRASFDSFLEDVDYKAALEYSDGLTNRQYRKDGAKIAEVQRGILATSQNTAAYDVFICYKESDENGQRTRDSLMAQDIYYQLTEQGRRVFFARITLEDVAGTQYEPYIFAALNSAKVMIVVGTKPEHLNAVWVKNEWSRFLAMMKKDRSKLLLPCYSGMDPYDLPEQLSVLQSYDMSKIGFIQDLTRGIAKVLDGNKEAVAVREQVVVQQAGSNAAALLKRGSLALEDGDWKRADEFYEEVLNQDAECAEAYLGKLLAARKYSRLDAMVDASLENSWQVKATRLRLEETDTAHIGAMVKECYIPNYVNKDKIIALYSFDLTYPSAVAGRQEQLESAERYWNQKLMNRAEAFASGDIAEKLRREKQRYFDTLRERIREAEQLEAEAIAQLRADYAAHLEQADAQARQFYADAVADRENHYKTLVEAMQTQTEPDKLDSYARSFDTMEDYADSRKLAEECRRRAEEERQRRKEEAQRKALLEEKALQEKIKRQNKLFFIGTAAAIAVIAVLLVVTKVIIPGNKYSKAEELLASGQYDEAIAIFTDLEDYKDSASRAFETRKAKLYYYGTELIRCGKENDEAGRELMTLAEQEMKEIEGAKPAVPEYAPATEAPAAEAPVEWPAEYEEEPAEEPVEEPTYELVLPEFTQEELYAMECFEAAEDVFDYLWDYSDSPAMMKSARQEIEAVEAALDQRITDTYAEAYAEAEKLLAEGKYDEARAIFSALGTYEDSAGRYLEVNRKETEAKAIQAQQKLKTAVKGDIVTFGHYEQDGNAQNGKEEIQWKVVEKNGNTLVLLSEKTLLFEVYNSVRKNKEWVDSKLYKTLNGTFYQDAFSEQEKTQIKETSYGKVYIPSLEELKRFFGIAAVQGESYKELYVDYTEAMEKDVGWWTLNHDSGWATRSFKSSSSYSNICIRGSLVGAEYSDEKQQIRPVITITVP